MYLLHLTYQFNLRQTYRPLMRPTGKILSHNTNKEDLYCGSCVKKKAKQMTKVTRILPAADLFSIIALPFLVPHVTVWRRPSWWISRTLLPNVKAALPWWLLDKYSTSTERGAEGTATQNEWCISKETLHYRSLGTVSFPARRTAYSAVVPIDHSHSKSPDVSNP